MDAVYTYVEMNVHAISDEDWNFVKENICQVLGRNVEVLPQSSTELLLQDINAEEARKLLNLLFIERVGLVIKLFEKSSNYLSDLVRFLRENSLRPVPRISDMRIRMLIKNSFRNVSGSLCLLRDLSIHGVDYVGVIVPIDETRFSDLENPWFDTFGSLSPIFVVCDLSSENELLSCVRSAYALRFRIYFVNPRLWFSDRKRRAEFWKFFNMSKSRIFTSLEECLEFLNKRKGTVVPVALSMHASSGEVTLLKIVKEHGVDRLVFVLGGEEWGLSPRQVSQCRYVVRVGPSTGVPLSVSEVMCYVTCMLRALLRA